MKIQELLDNLLHKKLGRDVRQNIHDSIEQCYKDATGHPDSVAAVIKENKEMQEHLDNTPYMTIEEESADLPVHTINDDEIGVASTWSSEKINGKIQEVFQSASNGKSKLAAAIGNGATADMTWDQLAGKVLQFNYQNKSGEGMVYFDKAFNNVVVWIIAGVNYGEDWTGFCAIKHMEGATKDKYEIKAGTDDVSSYGIKSDGSQAYAKTYPANQTHNTCYYYCYQIGYN
jgi:hypothetical protein